MLSVIELPEGMMPFELYGGLWVTITRPHGKKIVLGHDIRDEAGTADTTLFDIDFDFTDRPVLKGKRHWSLWSDDHKRAKIHFFTE